MARQFWPQLNSEEWTNRLLALLVVSSLLLTLLVLSPELWSRYRVVNAEMLAANG